MTIAEKVGLDNDTVRFILEGKYWMKTYSYPRSEWRKKLGVAYAKRKVGDSDKFVKAWEFLEREGLV